jgi:adenylate cyclase
MNFIMIKEKSVLIFFGLVFFFNFSLSSNTPISLIESGAPLIQRYLFPNFNLSAGKFSVYEDTSGIFLIGAKDKIIVFYGNEFLSINMTGQINVSSNQRSIFYTGYNSLGLIKLFKNSQPQLIPLVDNKLRKRDIFGQINNVFVSDDLIVFSNNNKLYQFNDTNFIQIDSSEHRLQLFNVANTIIEYKYESGLYKFFEGKLMPIPFSGSLIQKNIESILPFNNSLLIKCADNSYFLKIDNKGIVPMKFGFETFLDKAGFSDAIFIPGNNLAIGTKSAGVLIYNYKLNTIRSIGIDKGLLDNTVKNLHLDKAGNLWVLHENGISRIELNIPVIEYSYFAGISSKVNDIIKYNNKIFLATANGLLKSGINNSAISNASTQLYFSRVEGIINECIKVFTENNVLYAITPTGIYRVDNDEARLIFINDIYCFEKKPKSKGLYYLGNEDGLTLIGNSNNNFIIKERNSVNGMAVVEMAVENDSMIWIKTDGNKLLLLESSAFSGINDRSVFRMGKENGLPSDINNLHLIPTYKGVRFFYPDSVLKFNYTQNKFKNEEIIDLKYLKGIPWLVETLIDPSGNKWYHLSSSIENLQGVLMYRVSNDKTPEKPVFFNTGSLMSPIYIDSSTVWIGGENKLLQFNSKKAFNLPRNFSAIIKRVFIGKDSILRIGLEDPEIDFSYNNIKFEVSSTCFEGEPNIRYQYKLDERNKKWTNWTRESVFSFHRLSPGNYTFSVRALNIDGTVSDITSLKFNVLHPFYSTLPAYILYFFMTAFMAFIILRWRTWLFFKSKERLEKIVYERTEEILKEKEKSEQLIANLLPKGTADELKSTGKATSQKFAMATVLFSDIQGFTKIAEQMNPELLIDQLDAFFFQFDMVVEKYNIEKIKTIGDAYMCAGGIPNKNITNPVEVVLAALEMQEYMRVLKSKNVDIWDLRIGIHTGSVIAGVVGHKKMSYDIWGDTVNTASRMESSGEAGKINISGHTYELVKDFFICEYRGKMPVKYKGEIDMYFVTGIRPELASDMKHIPNKNFFTMLQTLRLQDVEDDVFEKMNKDLPDNLYFHNTSRIRDVYNLVDLFGRSEELSNEENLLLRTAVLLNDIGYIYGYDNHEDYSINYASELLPRYKYLPEQLEKVIELIEVTKGLRKPQNKSEEILLDAEMNYLSRADFVTLNELHFQELNEQGKSINREEWLKEQLVLLSNHKYYTRVANVLRDVSAEQQIENLLSATKKSRL